MRAYWTCGLLVWICWTGTAQPLRTPEGVLWAGSTFSLRATATTQDGHLLGASEQAIVTVGEVIHWRVAIESEPALTVPGSEGWFMLMVENRSNTVDALNLRIRTTESADAHRWSIAMLEQREDGSGFNDGLLLTDSTSLMMPGEARRLYLRVRPPSNRNTDGAWINWVGVSQCNPALTFLRDFACGVEAAQWEHTNASTTPYHRIIGQPLLIQGRLYWLTWDGYLLRLYRTPNPLSVNTTFANNISLEARVHMPEPTHQTVLIGDRWYLLTRTGEIVFFLLSEARGATTLSAEFINLPSEVTPDLNLPLVNCAGNLCFVDRQSRIWVFDSATELFTALLTFSSQPISHLTVLNGNLLAVGREDGQVDIYNSVAPVLVGLRAPGASGQPVQFVGIYQEQLIVAAGDTLAAYNIDTDKWLWVRTLDSAIVAPPVLEAFGKGSCYALTEGGWLYGFSLLNGGMKPLYPRRLFETWVARAALNCLTRADREAPYLYLQAELADGTVRTLFITATNPLNRFVHPTTLVNTPIGSHWLFTGNTDQDLAIQWVSWGASSQANRGAFYAYRLR